MARYSLIQSNDRIVEIIKTDREITLEWESYSDSDVSYNLYFKIHGSPLWRSLDTVYNGTPRFSLSISRIGEGSWDFGVSAVDSEGYESEIHSSLDYSADPAAGWYLTWMEE
ncbi:MAG: hypothetical protein JXR86_04540 [Spirochaetales bacterium]|nr:hypothetical protein [Spirochaetales bacterium]